MQKMQKNDGSTTKKAKNFIDNNRVVAVICLALSLLAWVIVTTYIMPNTTKVISNVPIDYNYKPENYNNLGLVIVDDRLESVSVEVEGDGNVINSLTAADIKVYVDYSNVKGEETYTLDIRAENISQKKFTVIGPKISKVTLAFREKDSKIFTIQGEAPGITAAGDVVKGTLVVTPSVVQVDGPKELIDKIDRIVAFIYDESIISETTIFAGVKLIVYDVEGREIDTKDLVISSETVDVKVPVIKIIDLPVSVSFAGLPLGFDTAWLQNKIQLSHPTISVAGEPAAFNSVHEIEVGPIDVSRISLEDTTFVLPVALPKALTNYENVENVEVSISMLGMSEKSFSVSDIRASNVPSGLTVKIVDTKISNVVILGENGQISTLLPENIIIEVDCYGLTAAQSGEQILAARIIVAGRDKAFAVGEYEVRCIVEVSS